jgi:hypothetical protein
VIVVDAAALNNVVGASARLRRAPEYTAQRLWRCVGGGAGLDGAWPTSSRGSRRVATSERYRTLRSRVAMYG